MERAVRIFCIVGPAESMAQLIVQSRRNMAKVIMPATIWFFVRLEIQRPIEMNDAPIRSSPRYPVTIGFHSGFPYSGAAQGRAARPLTGPSARGG